MGPRTRKLLVAIGKKARPKEWGSTSRVWWEQRGQQLPVWRARWERERRGLAEPARLNRCRAHAV